MAKLVPKVAPKKEVKVTPKPTPKATTKPHYLPKFLLFFGFFLLALAVVDYFKYLNLDARIIDAILLFTGLWIIKIALGKASYNRRKDVLMKYI